MESRYPFPELGWPFTEPYSAVCRRPTRPADGSEQDGRKFKVEVTWRKPNKQGSGQDSYAACSRNVNLRRQSDKKAVLHHADYVIELPR